jgi:hypothetical protein
MADSCCLAQGPQVFPAPLVGTASLEGSSRRGTNLLYSRRPTSQAQLNSGYPPSPHSYWLVSRRASLLVYNPLAPKPLMGLQGTLTIWWWWWL